MTSFQTQFYAPKSVWGFRFGPYFLYSLGILGDDTHSFTNKPVYQQFGLGVLIKNENLVFRTFQLSIAYFPVIPGSGTNVFKTNAFESQDIGLSDFEFGKPSVVGYE